MHCSTIYEVKHSRLSRGFTLIELLIVMVIVTMTVVIALPNLRRIRVKASTNQAILGITRTFDLARSEALKRHSPVGILYDSLAQNITVFEDWHPDNLDVPSNGNRAFDSGEDRIDSRFFPAEIRSVGAPAADPLPLSAASQVFYKSDGSLISGEGAVYVSDKVGNVFRVRINDFTGTVNVEQWLEETSTWSGKRETWVWKY